jgi:excisionase family DNA binding protein
MGEASVHLTLKRAAQELGVHEQTLRAWEKRGLIRMVRLPGSRYRRVPVEEVERLKREMTSTQAGPAVHSGAPAQDAKVTETVQAELADNERFGEGEYRPNTRVITVREPSAVYGVPLDEAVLAQGPVVLEREGRPVAALIAADEYRVFQGWRRSRSWREEQLAHFQSERVAFQRLLPELLKTHAGQFVAIHDSRMVDADTNEGELAWRVIGRGLKPVYIGEVRSEPRIYDVPSLEVIPDVSL